MSAITSASLPLYHPQHMERVDPKTMLEKLKAYDSFDVFCEFHDPRTDVLVQQQLTFYPEPVQVMGGGWAFVAEYQGVPIRIPCDWQWWQQHAGRMVTRRYPISVLKRGRYVQVSFALTINACLRVNKPNT